MSKDFTTQPRNYEYESMNIIVQTEYVWNENESKRYEETGAPTLIKTVQLHLKKNNFKRMFVCIIYFIWHILSRNISILWPSVDNNSAVQLTFVFFFNWLISFFHWKIRYCNPQQQKYERIKRNWVALLNLSDIWFDNFHVIEMRMGKRIEYLKYDVLVFCLYCFPKKEKQK